MAEDYKKAFEREERRIAPYQQLPEWKQWLADTRSAVAEFTDTHLPDHKVDPWSDPALRRAEQLAIETFPDTHAANPAKSPSNKRTIEQFHRYLGEGIVQKFEGNWLNLDLEPNDWQPGIGLPYSSLYVDLHTTLYSAIMRRTGQRWVTFFARQAEEYSAWVGAKRPAPAIWAQVKEDTFAAGKR